MSNYDFKTLSAIDFEDLCRDLLQKELRITLDSFKPGKDEGVDFRYYKNMKESIIIQCKHYADSNYAKLYHVLKYDELNKVKKHKPKKYTIATSLGLSKSEKKNICDTFKPFMKHANPIYGKRDLNNLIGKYPEIEKQHFKLWLSSTSVLEGIFNRVSKSISEEAFQKIKEHVKYYVLNDSYKIAFDLLKDNNYCVIAGSPGIGKTILAEMLIIYYISEGYKLIKITEDIKEASSVDYKNEKIIYYYDDFLGRTSFDEKINKNKDEKKCIIDLKKYTRYIKAKILYNHLYFSDLPSAYINELIKNKEYLKIIDHKNYNPRIISEMSKKSMNTGVSANDFVKIFLQNLDNPLLIWKSAFSNRLSQASRNLLMLMFTLPNKVFIEDLRCSYIRYNGAHSKEYNYHINSTDFQNALEECKGDFITFEKDKNKITVGYCNPSIKDFILGFIKENKNESVIFLKASVFFTQIESIWNVKDNLSISELLNSNIAELISAIIRTISDRDFEKETIKRSYIFMKERSFEQRLERVVSIGADINNDELNKAIMMLIVNYQRKIIKGKSIDNEHVLLLKAI